jgi:hypothetical protein
MPSDNPALNRIFDAEYFADRPRNIPCSTGICGDLQASLTTPPEGNLEPQQARPEPQQVNSKVGRKAKKKRRRRGSS